MAAAPPPSAGPGGGSVITSRSMIGSIAGPIRVTAADGDHDFILHKRDKGDVGTPVAKLVYVKSVTIGK